MSSGHVGQAPGSESPRADEGCAPSLALAAGVLHVGGRSGDQAGLIWFARLPVFMTYLTRLTSTCFTEFRSRASHSTMGT
jgi:hypothetical protein